MIEKIVPLEKLAALRKKHPAVIEPVLKVRRNILAATSRPLLSVIVPVYNVEGYVAETLESILITHDINLEIVVVNDGSTDGSLEVVKKFQSRDPRVRVHSQPNAGLGAARNKGISLARGRYIAFIDSDDLAERASLSKLVRSLEETGSDFAVGRYRHLSNGRLGAAGPWILGAHANPGTFNLESNTAILVNAIVCSKVFRKSFWHRVGLAFPEGVLFEDQEVSTAAYCRATAFDVLDVSLIQWRRRETGDSITQQVADPDNLKQRFDSAFKSLKVLHAHGKIEAVQNRAAEYLANRTFTLGQLVHGSSEYWAEMLQGVTQLWSMTSEDLIRTRVSATDKVLFHLIMANEFDLATSMVRDGAHQINHWRSVKSSIGYSAQWPGDEDLTSHVPSWAFELSRNETPIVGTIKKYFWSDPKTVVVEGDAYIANFPISDNEEFTISLIDEQSAIELPGKVTRVTTNGGRTRSAHRYIDYSNAGFIVKFDLSDLLEDAHRFADAGKTFSLVVRIAGNGVVREGHIKKRMSYGTADVLSPEYPVPGIAAETKWTRTHGLTLELGPSKVQVESIEFREGKPEVKFNVVGQEAEDITSVALTGGTKNALNLLPHTGRQHSGKSFILAEPSRIDEQTKVVAKTGLTKTSAVALGTFTRVPDPSRFGMYFNRSSDGALTLTPVNRVYEILGIELKESQVYLEIRVPVETDAEVSVEFSGTIETAMSSAKSGRDSTVRVLIPHRIAGDSSRSERTLRTGIYHLRVSVEGEASNRQQLVSDELQSQLPHYYALDDAVIRLRRISATSVGIEILSPEAVASRAAFTFNERVTEYRHNSVGTDNTVYLQCLRGDQANDTQLSVANYLQQNHPEFEVVWGVLDYSVVVPAGQRRVCIGSEEYFDVISRAKFLFFNHEVPAHFVPKVGRYYIQTYHGHPFKQMGMGAWKKKALTSEQIETSLRSREIWDFLLSPGPVATKLYTENYPLDYEILEVGHPRNDLLALATEEQVQAARKSLAIPDGKKVVLYAPTYRDLKSTNPWSSPMVDFVSVTDLARELGSDYVVLLRGHPANGRFSEKVSHGAGIIDVTFARDVNDLILAADIGVFDYSSIRFDFSVTGKPMIFLVPDKDEYFEFTPGLLDFDQTAPGPQVDDLNGLMSAISDIERVQVEFAQDYKRFREMFNPLDDGLATKRFVEEIILRTDSQADTQI